MMLKFSGLNLQNKIFSKLYTLRNTTSFENLYFKLVMLDNKRMDIFNDNDSTYVNYFLKKENTFNGDILFEMQNKDIQNYLPDDILTKVDRASMQNSLEVRCPLLDHRLNNAIFLKKNYKIEKEKTKKILRNILKKYIDLNLISKNKKGFAIPIKTWLNSSLKNSTNNYINSSLLKNDEFLNQNKIIKIWDEHKKGLHDHTNIIWATLIYLQWKQYWKNL